MMRDGASAEEASAAADFYEGEASFWIKRDKQYPPPQEAFEPIRPPTATLQMKEFTMATPTKEHEENGDISGEYQRPDAAAACKIYDEQIKPKLTHINTLKGDLSEPWDLLKEQSRVPRVVFNFVQKLVDEDDDQKRDHMIISLNELMKARVLGLPTDLVSLSKGEEGGSAIPTLDRKRPFLAGIDGGKAKLAAADFDEASAEELAGQTVRPSTEADQAAAEEAAEQEG